jgi:hypothetical protein
MFAGAQNWSLSWARWIHSTPTSPIKDGGTYFWKVSNSRKTSPCLAPCTILRSVGKNWRLLRVYNCPLGHVSALDACPRGEQVLLTQKMMSERDHNALFPSALLSGCSTTRRDVRCKMSRRILYRSVTYIHFVPHRKQAASPLQQSVS